MYEISPHSQSYFIFSILSVNLNIRVEGIGRRDDFLASFINLEADDEGTRLNTQDS
jgi:hypothetical protein